MIKAGNIKEDFNRDLYCTKFDFISEEKNKKTAVFACASWEFLCDLNRVNKLSDKHLKKWQNNVLAMAKKRGDSLYNSKSHYFIFANTEEGKKNGLAYLKEVWS